MLEQRFPRALLLNEHGEDRVIRDGNFEFLGAPVGSPQYMSEEIRKRAAKASSLASEIAKLNDPQVGLRLLKHCASFCKVVYTMRTVPPTVQAEALESFDGDIRAAFENLTGLQPDDGAWARATLGMAHSGLGLRSASRHAPAAFVASRSSTQALCVEID